VYISVFNGNSDTCGQHNTIKLPLSYYEIQGPNLKWLPCLGGQKIKYIVIIPMCETVLQLRPTFHSAKTLTDSATRDELKSNCTYNIKKAQLEELI